MYSITFFLIHLVFCLFVWVFGGVFFLLTYNIQVISALFNSSYNYEKNLLCFVPQQSMVSICRSKCVTFISDNIYLTLPLKGFNFNTLIPLQKLCSLAAIFWEKPIDFSVLSFCSLGVCNLVKSVFCVFDCPKIGQPLNRRMNLIQKDFIAGRPSIWSHKERGKSGFPFRPLD